MLHDNMQKMSSFTRELAAQVWCKPNTRHLVMIPEIAEEFAKILEQREQVIVELRLQLETLANREEQLRVQMAGILVAAEGGTKNPAVQGQYGWSFTYQTVLELRKKYDLMISPPTCENSCPIINESPRNPFYDK